MALSQPIWFIAQTPETDICLWKNNTTQDDVVSPALSYCAILLWPGAMPCLNLKQLPQHICCPGVRVVFPDRDASKLPLQKQVTGLGILPVARTRQTWLSLPSHLNIPARAQAG